MPVEQPAISLKTQTDRHVERPDIPKLDLEHHKNDEKIPPRFGESSQKIFGKKKVLNPKRIAKDAQRSAKNLVSFVWHRFDRVFAIFEEANTAQPSLQHTRTEETVQEPQVQEPPVHNQKKTKKKKTHRHQRTRTEVEPMPKNSEHADDESQQTATGTPTMQNVVSKSLTKQTLIYIRRKIDSTVYFGRRVAKMPIARIFSVLTSTSLVTGFLSSKSSL